MPRDYSVSHGGVSREAVDYSSKRVRVEEEHWSPSHSMEHGAVESIAEMHEDASDEETRKSRYYNSHER